MTQLDRILEPIRNRIRAVVSRAIVTKVSGGADGLHAEIELGAGEVRDEVELVQQYGFTSRPAGAVGAVAVFVSGSRESGIVIATKGLDTDMVFTLAEGEVAIHTAEGDSVHLKRGRVVAITTETLEINAATAVRINSPTVTTSGDLSAATVADQLGSLASVRNAHNIHTHVCAAPGSPSGPAVPGA